MLTLTQTITDPELGAAPFTVLRSFYRQSAGEKIFDHLEEYETFGSVHPAKMEDLQLLPEEYRSEQVLVFHSPVPLSLGSQLTDTTFTAPDRILYQFVHWLVISVRDWSSFGFCKAYAVRIKGET